MNDYTGGIEPNAMVNVLERKTQKARTKKICELKPGDWLGQVDSKWHFLVDEVRIFKRELRAYKFTLESGEKLTVAKNTILCGQYGGNLVSDQKNEVLCFVNMGRFVDSGHSRRTFKIEFKSPPKHSSRLRTICRHSANTWRKDFEKKFYNYSSVLKFLRELKAKLPNARVVQGLEIHNHYKENLYDICEARSNDDIFFPLFQFNGQHDDAGVERFPAVLAFCPSDRRTESRKVVSCEEIKNDGPWVFPVFDNQDDLTTFSQQRFSFTANGIPVFCPNEFIDRWAVKVTMPKDGEPLLPHIPTAEEKRMREPVCEDLDSVYDSLADLTAPAEKLSNEAFQAKCNSIFRILVSLTAGQTDKRILIDVLEKKVIAVHRKKLGNHSNHRAA